MIAAEQLRIGNWVYANSPLMQVMEIHKNGVGLYMPDSEADLFHADIEDVRGIPLSPEVLEKCGFEDNVNYNSFDIEVKGCGIISVDKDDLSFLLCCKDVENELGFTGSVKSCVKYLHQLQNLYYALTGEEINFNP